MGFCFATSGSKVLLLGHDYWGGEVSDEIDLDVRLYTDPLAHYCTRYEYECECRIVRVMQVER